MLIIFQNYDGVIYKFHFLIKFTGFRMYVVESRGGAIACMLLALFFLGTWPAILTLLERRGRLPQHTYLDYTITNLLASVIIAFTFGELGHTNDGKPNFIVQLSQNNWPSVLFAMAGGVVLSLGTLSTQYAWAFVGLSVTEVMTSSIAVIIGTTSNYFLDDKINRAEILFPGVACFLIAACLGSLVHTSDAKDNKLKLDKLGLGSNDMVQMVHDRSTGKDLENGSLKVAKAKGGTANFLIEIESRRSIKVFGRSTLIGLALCLFAGICFSLFSPAFNLATNDQWHTLDYGVPYLSVYTAFFCFSCSCFVIGLILNIIFLYRPLFNLPTSSIKAYLSDWDGRGWAFLAGFLCGFGNGLQFMGGQAAGYAAAGAVQAFPLVITFWGMLFFGEYRKSSKRTYGLLVGMLSMFVVAIVVLMASSGHRKHCKNYHYKLTCS
ncbi:ureide permease 1-like isoform X2 [Rutidosis leptorrhynchoides]|uniref:ureide permease 1-like isoform X2 n=1 Tax=Rutidosis leptorrhynchoides TaxID=125765 RepID=UPI003A98F519